MKIDRLYTLIQFVDFMKNEEKESNTNWRFDQILKYNDFLKQPLKKEMFVNQSEHPLDLFCNGAALEEAYELYEEAQKKVIFDGWSQSIYMKYEIIKGTDIVDFSNYDFPKLSQRNSQIVSVKTLHDLSEATNGELKLKNIEL